MPNPRTAIEANSFALPALLLGAACISFGPILVRISEIGPTATGFWWVAFSIPFVALWMARGRRGHGHDGKVLERSDFPILCLPGLFFAADLALWHWTITLTSVANATILSNSAPIFVTFGAYFLFKERITRTFLVGLALAIAGVVVLMGDSFSAHPENLLGDAVGIATAVFYAAYISTIGRLRATYSTATLMTSTGIVSAILLAPLALVSGESLFAMSATGWLIVFGLAVTTQVVGQSLIAFGLAHLTAAFGSVSLMLQPVGAAILAWLILAEPLGLQQFAGGVIVLAGIILANRGR